MLQRAAGCVWSLLIAAQGDPSLAARDTKGGSSGGGDVTLAHKLV